MYMYYHGLLGMPIPTGAFTSMQDCHDPKYPTPTHMFGVGLWKFMVTTILFRAIIGHSTAAP